MGTGEGALQTGLVVHVSRDDFGAELGELARFGGIDVARDRTRRKTSVFVIQDRANKSATLRTGGADDCDDFLFRHK